MNERYLAAAVQLNSRDDRAANLAAAEHWIETAAQQGAQLVALPEMFTCFGSPAAILSAAELIPGPTSARLSALAARLRITLVAGSFPEQSERADRIYNTSLLFGPDGALLSTYRKVHLFDVDLPGRVTVRESDWCLPGEALSVTATPCGRVGVAICYDLRFPELFRALASSDMDVLVLPAAFTQTTGRDHWELLVRARAVENQVFVVAPNQCGANGAGQVSFGHSMIVDPWGTPLATAADGAGLALAEIDFVRMADIRRQLPALTHRRLTGDRAAV